MDNATINNIKPHLEFSLIDLPLFSKYNKQKVGEQVTYIIDDKQYKYKHLEITPPVNLAIPNEFDQRVYLALVMIYLESNPTYQNSPEHKLYTTYYEIFKKLKLQPFGKINERILQSLYTLMQTGYTFLGASPLSPLVNRTNNKLYTAKLIQNIGIIYREDNKFNVALNDINSTKSNEILEINFDSFFLFNLLNNSNDLVYKYNSLINLNDAIARSIYLYCEGVAINNKTRITAKKLASIIPMSFTNNTFTYTVNRIGKALEFLIKERLVTKFTQYKTKPLARTFYEIEFSSNSDTE